VTVEHDVDIGDRVAGRDAGIKAAQQMLGRDQHLVAAKEQFGMIAGDKQPVLR